VEHVLTPQTAVNERVSRVKTAVCGQALSHKS